MPSTRSTSSSDGERKPNTRSKGGGGVVGSKGTSWNCTKSSQGRSLTKQVSIPPVSRSKNSQREQDPKHGGRKGNKILDSKVTISKINQGPVEKSKRGRKPLIVIAKSQETVSCLPNDNKEENNAMSDSPQKVGSTNGSASDQKTSLEASSNLSTDNESNHSQSTYLLNGNQVDISPKEISGDTEHINGSITTPVSRNNSENSVCNPVLQKNNSALYGLISSDELELLDKSGDDDKRNDNPSTLDNNSVLGADDLQNESTNCSADTISERILCDNPLSAPGALQTDQVVFNSDSDIACSDKGSPQEASLRECDKAPSSSKSKKSYVAVVPATIRKSERRSIPNRKYLDMETDFSLKKSKTATSSEKKSVKSSTEQPKELNSQNPRVPNLKRKPDLNTEKSPASKKQIVKEDLVNMQEEKEKEKKCSQKSVQPLPKATFSKKKSVSTISTLVKQATHLLKKQLPSPTQKVAPTILKIATNQTSPTILKIATQKSPTILKIATTQKSPTHDTLKLVQSLSTNQPDKTADLIMNNTNNSKGTQPVLLAKTEQLPPSENMLTASKNSDSVPNNSALNEEVSENLTLYQTTNALGDATQRLDLPVNNSPKTSENSSKVMPTISDTVSSSLNSGSNNKLEQPVLDSAEPVVDSAEPAVDSAEPVVDSAEPVVDSAEPVVHSAEPVVHSAEPVVHSAEPVVHSAEPVVHSAEPVVHSAEPAVHSTELVVHSAEPVVHSAEPVTVHSAEPVTVHSAEPVVHSAEPVTVHSAEPVAVHSAEPVAVHSAERIVHSTEPVEPKGNQTTDVIVADKNPSKELTETSESVAQSSVPQIVMSLPNTISSATLQNSSLTTSPVGSMAYSVDMTMLPTKPIISFTEGISQTSPYTVSLLNNNNNSINKDKEAVESLMNATHIAEKVSESGSVMMCLSSGMEDLVPNTVTLDVNTHPDAHQLETKAAIQELTASFPQAFPSNDIEIHEKDQITKTSISLAEAAKMVAESQTIVDLPDVNSLSACGLEELHSQPTPVVREVSTTTLPTAVASTQTPLQLPRKNLRASSLMKSLSANIHQSGKVPLDMDDDEDDDDDDDEEDDDDMEDDCFDNNEVDLKPVEPRKSTQEFIVVHLPEGAQIKRERVDSKHQIDSLSRGQVDENGSYQCTECNYVTVKKANWYKHRKKHLGLRPHCCLKCDYKATTSSNLKRHMAIHADLREYKCNLCSNYFRQKIHLERHMKYKHEEKKVQCPLCNYVCASENPDLKTHFKRRHVPSTYGTMNSFTCDECGFVTISKKDLKQHAKFHRRGPELKLFCEQCSFVTDCESRLRRHVFTHAKVKPFKCGLCDYRGSQKEHVLRHMKFRHSIEIQRNPRRPREDECNLDSSDRDRTDFTSRDKIFACKHCTMKFSKLINLYKHLHTQHKNIMPMGDQNEFFCVVCDFKTTSKKNLLVHMRKHNMQEQNPPSHVYSCVLCRYVNPKRRNLFQHMMKKHGIEIVMNMKDDWSSNCYATNNAPLLLDKGDDIESNIMTVGSVVTATSDESNQLMVVTEDTDSSTMQAVITIEDLASSMTNPVKMSEVSVNTGANGEPLDKMLTDELNQQQHAADAIEGLQALAEHPRVVDHENHFKCDDDVIPKIEDKVDAESGLGVNNEINIVTEKNMSELDEATVSVIDQLTTEAPIKESFELTTDQVVHLSTGDYVEINGEVYKVEISTEPAEETVTTTGASDSTNTELFETIVQNETTATPFLT